MRSIVIIWFGSHLGNQDLASYCPIPSSLAFGLLSDQGRHPVHCCFPAGVDVQTVPILFHRNYFHHLLSHSHSGLNHCHVPVHNMIMIQEQYLLYSKCLCKYFLHHSDVTVCIIIIKTTHPEMYLVLVI